MNAAAHYRAGERLLANADADLGSPVASEFCALAHAHFAAALVGATLLAGHLANGLYHGSNGLRTGTAEHDLWTAAVER